MGPSREDRVFQHRVVGIYKRRCWCVFKQVHPMFRTSASITVPSLKCRTAWFFLVRVVKFPHPSDPAAPQHPTLESGQGNHVQHLLDSIRSFAAHYPEELPTAPPPPSRTHGPHNRFLSQRQGDAIKLRAHPFIVARHKPSSPLPHHHNDRGSREEKPGEPAGTYHS